MNVTAATDKDELSPLGIGLIEGKLGLCINLYHLAKHLNIQHLEDRADQILDEIFAEAFELNGSIKVYFSTGLAGIGWGIEHLIKQGFVQGDTQTILEDIDNSVLQVARGINMKNFGLTEGYLGICKYLIEKFENPDFANDDDLFCLETKLALISYCDQAYIHLSLYDEVFIEPSVLKPYWNLPNYINMLAGLYDLNIINIKVKKCINVIESKLSGRTYKNSANKLMLAASLYNLNSRYALKTTTTNFLNELLDTYERGQIEYELSLIDNKIRFITFIVHHFDHIIQYHSNEFLQNELMFWMSQLRLEYSKINKIDDWEYLQGHASALGVNDGYLGFYLTLKYLKKYFEN